VSDIITSEETGLLCPVGDADALADALRRLLVDGGLRDRLGGAAQAFHRRHLDVPPYVARMKSIWALAAASAGPKRG
jgi:glycosyltransferase involved in cell wall biosynthesis